MAHAKRKNPSESVLLAAVFKLPILEFGIVLPTVQTYHSRAKTLCIRMDT